MALPLTRAPATRREIPGSLSPSKVSSFRDCALAFRFSVIDRLPEPPSPSAAKGTVVHRALELLFQQPAPERTLTVGLELVGPAADEVLATDEYLSLELDDREAFVTQARSLVERYFRLEDPTTIEPVGLELLLEAEIGGVLLRGIIDRLDEDADGNLVVTDYKTGRVPGERYEQSKLGGVHFYAYLCELALGRRPARVQLLYLAEPIAIVAEPSDQSIKGLERRVGAVWQAVERACERDDFRPHPGRLCDWCSFKAHCPAFGGDPAQVESPVPVSR
jgi:putative RecB family exonuclease